MERGWVSEEAGIFEITDPGREIRQAAEGRTDDYFYLPWSCLSQVETEELRNLLRCFHEGLQPGV